MAINKNVYILGAGFSAEAGMPLVSNFLDRIRDISVDLDIQGKARKDYLSPVLNYRKEMSCCADKVDIDLDNIEQLFSLAAIDSLTEGRHKTLADNIKHAIAFTLANPSAKPRPATFSIHPLAVDEIPEHLSYLDLKQEEVEVKRPNMRLGWEAKHDVYVYALGLMAGLFDSSVEQENVFITFNYDLVIEEALKQWGLVSDYRLIEPTDHRSTIGARDHIEVIKLHGSVNWTLPADNKSGQAVHIFDDYDSVPPDHQLVLQPPTWRKDPAPGVAPLWKLAANHISDAWRICVIGYSTPPTDTHFEYLLALGLSRNERLHRFIVIDPDASPHDPDPGRVYTRYRDFLNYHLLDRRFEAIGHSWTDSFRIPEITSGLLERRTGIVKVGYSTDEDEESERRRQRLSKHPKD